MVSLPFRRPIVLGALVVLAGCGDAAVDSAGFAGAPAREAQGGPSSGTGGMNGASPAAFHANIMALLAAFDVAAADASDASAVSAALAATGLLGTEGGRQVFEYAARCALPAGTWLKSGANVYAGGGILSTTASWLTGGLTTSQKEDALTCMVTHLNPFGTHVPIFLSGPSVAGTENGNDEDFTVEEAVWQVKIPGPDQAPIYYAWPRTNLLSTCGLLTSVSWITRICGTALNTCGVQIRYDRSTACTGSNGTYSCDGKPAIQTTLEESDLCILHIGLL